MSANPSPPSCLTVSSVIFTNFSPNLFLNLYNQLLFAVNGLVPPVSGDLLLKSSCKPNALQHNTLLLIGIHCLVISTSHKCNAFSILSKRLPHTRAVTCNLRQDGKINTDFFASQLLSQRFILTIDLSNLNTHFFLSLSSKNILFFHWKDFKSSL